MIQDKIEITVEFKPTGLSQSFLAVDEDIYRINDEYSNNPNWQNQLKAQILSDDGLKTSKGVLSFTPEAVDVISFKKCKYVGGIPLNRIAVVAAIVVAIAIAI